jgi:hypothetical protein
MARRLIDISVPLQTTYPPIRQAGSRPSSASITSNALPRMLQFFDGLKAADLPDGQGWAVEQVQLSTHMAPIWTRPGIFIPP